MESGDAKNDSSKQNSELNCPWRKRNFRTQKKQAAIFLQKLWNGNSFFSDWSLFEFMHLCLGFIRPFYSKNRENYLIRWYILGRSLGSTFKSLLKWEVMLQVVFIFLFYLAA